MDLETPRHISEVNSAIAFLTQRFLFIYTCRPDLLTSNTCQQLTQVESGVLTVDVDAVVFKNLGAMFEDNRLKPWRQLHQQRLYVTQAVTRNHAIPSEQICEK